MSNKESQNKACIIYNLMSNTKGNNIYYNIDGSLNFNFKSSTYLSCRITPVEDKYSIKIYTPINRETTEILYKIDNVDGSELYNTFHVIIKYLDNEWDKWNKYKWKGSWYRYSNNKLFIGGQYGLY